jgi:hypothetical protein
MLDEILTEFEKVREKDNSTKNIVNDLFGKIKQELFSLESSLECLQNEMSVK